ncbi:hypothetical protein [Psychroflexus torquis]|nr:hypothetical protein [Psychroflexus torquis]
MQVLPEMEFDYFPIYIKMDLNKKVETQQEELEASPEEDKIADDNIE